MPVSHAERGIATAHPDLAPSHPDPAPMHPDQAQSHLDLATSHPGLVTSHLGLATSHPDLVTSHPDLATNHLDRPMSMVVSCDFYTGNLMADGRLLFCKGGSSGGGGSWGWYRLIEGAIKEYIYPLGTLWCNYKIMKI